MTWLSNDEQQAVDYFWELVGEKEVYPRSLEHSISIALPIAIIKMPRLALDGVETWLRMRQINYSFNCESRFVRGCMIAYAGKGLIFCDGTDPTDEIRYTLAHELGHFLADYWLPRQKAIAKLGINILEVLDGERKPTIAERIHSVFETATIDAISNLMDRQNVSEATSRVEDKADRIGFGLLASPTDVLRGVNFQESKFEQRQEILIERLVNYFGLPALASKIYSNDLLRFIGKGPSWAESIRAR